MFGGQSAKNGGRQGRKLEVCGVLKGSGAVMLVSWNITFVRSYVEVERGTVCTVCTVCMYRSIWLNVLNSGQSNNYIRSVSSGKREWRKKNKGAAFLCNEPNFDSQVTQTPMSTSLNQWFSRQWKRCEDTWRVKLEGTCWDQKARLKTEIFELNHVCFWLGGLEPNKF